MLNPFVGKKPWLFILLIVLMSTKCSTIRNFKADRLQELVTIVGNNHLIKARLSGGFTRGVDNLGTLEENFSTTSHTKEVGQDLDLLSDESRAGINRGIGGSVGNYKRAKLIANINSVDQKKIEEISNDVYEELLKQPSPKLYRTLAATYLFSGKLEEAITKLEEAKEEFPQDAMILNDLAVCYFTRQDDSSSYQDTVKALNAIEAAIEMDPNLPEAYFNQALILDKLCLFLAGQSKWKKYLEIEPSEEWKAIAKSYIKNINYTLSGEVWEKEKRQLAEAVLTDDKQQVRKIVSSSPHFARLYVINELIPNWAKMQYYRKEVVDKDFPKDPLKLSSLIGELLIEIQQDHQISDLVASIKAALKWKEKDLSEFLKAYLSYEEGAKLIEKASYTEAFQKLKSARSTFVSFKKTTELVMVDFQLAQYQAVRQHYKKALQPLEEVKNVAEQNSYPYLLGRAFWTVSFSQMSMSQLSETVESGKIALKYLHQAGDIEGCARVKLIIAEALDQMKNRHEIWNYQRGSLDLGFKVKSATKNGTLVKILHGIASQLASLQEIRASLYFCNEAINMAEKTGISAHILTNIYIRRSWIHHQMGKIEASLEDLRNAHYYLEKIEDKVSYQNLLAEIVIAESTIKLQINPEEVAKNLTVIVDKYKNSYHRYRIAFVYSTLAQAYFKLGKYKEAEDVRNKSIEELERERNSISDDRNRLSFFESAQAVYDEMIEYQVTYLKRIDTAFNFAERARARALLDRLNQKIKQDVALKSEREELLRDKRDKPTPFAIDEVQRRLPDKTALIEYTVLKDRLVIWLVTQKRKAFVEADIKLKDLEWLVGGFRQGIRTGKDFERRSQALYQAIFPLELTSILESDKNLKTLVIIPDKSLYSVAFAALTNRRKEYLIKDYELIISPSATVFIKCLLHDDKLASAGDRGAIVVGNTQFGVGVQPLFYPEKEAKNIAEMYRKANLDVSLLIDKDATVAKVLSLATKHTVIHIASHAIVNYEEPFSSKILLNTDKTHTEFLTAHEIYKHRFPNTRLAVLAACQTAGSFGMQGEGAASLARPFLAAGVPTVIASLWDVDDLAASKLFEKFHREKSSGKTALHALRAAQLECLSSKNPKISSPSNWASFLLIGGCRPSK
ncbi:MAG: CHAT domain-containing protein [Blastocatellia bacterium]|nr:CHAT domain-containing protein [Blastocatellia bacterium]